MEARFRIRTREGEELRPKTTEIFAEFIRSGVVRPEDLVYDALTGDWIPAGTHPMVRLVRDPLVTGWDSFADEPPPPAPGEDRPQDDESQLGAALDLVVPEDVSPEEEARVFIQQMEEERAADPDEPPLSREIALVVEGTGGPSNVPEPEPPRVPAPTPASSPEPRRPRRASGWHAAAHVTVAEAADERRSWGRIGLLGLATALSVAALAVFAAVARPSLRVGDHMPDLAGTPAVEARAPHTLDNTEEAVRGAAYEHFLASMDGLRNGLDVGAVPGTWLTGRYLSEASAYPEVRRYWERYLSYVEQARADEAGLYRKAYLEALDQAGATGPVRSLRLATALGDFDGAAANRRENYGHAWELAAAALALHDTLVQLEGRIRYEPARGPRVSADPVIEAIGADSDTQARLDAALDRVLRALRVEGPALVPAGIPGWLARSLRDAQGQDAAVR